MLHYRISNSTLVLACFPVSVIKHDKNECWEERLVSLILSLLSREVRAGAAAVTGGVLPTGLSSMPVSAYLLVPPRASYPRVAPPTVGWTFPHDYLVEVGVGLLRDTASLHLL